MRLSALVTKSAMLLTTKWSHQLLHYFNEQECLSFLQKFYGCQPVDSDECQTLCWINPSQRYLWDDFPVQCVDKYNYSVQMEVLHIVANAVPVGLMSHIMAGVKELFFSMCTLYGTAADSRDRDEKVRLTSEGAADTPAGSCALRLYDDVKGLDCFRDVTLPGIGLLDVTGNKHIDLGLLSCTFTELTQLNLDTIQSVELSTDKGCREWDTLKRLQVKDLGDIHLSIFAKLCTQLDDLLIVDCQRVVLDSDGSVTRWPSVSRLVLQSSPVETSTGQHLTEGKARQRLSEMFPSAEIYMYGYHEQVHLDH